MGVFTRHSSVQQTTTEARMPMRDPLTISPEEDEEQMIMRRLRNSCDELRRVALGAALLPPPTDTLGLSLPSFSLFSFFSFLSLSLPSLPSLPSFFSFLSFLSLSFLS